MRWRRIVLLSLPLLALAGQIVTLILAARHQTDPLARLRARGELIVATRESPSTWYPGVEGATGPEHDLVTGLARELGLHVRFVVIDDIDRLLALTRQGAVHMAAAGLTITRERRNTLRFSIPYQQVHEQLVYRRGTPRPKSLDRIPPLAIQVVAGSAHEDTLKRLRKRHPALRWIARRHVDLHELLEGVEAGRVRFTVADDNELLLASRIYRHLAPAFDLRADAALAWAFPAFGSDALREAANRYLRRIREDGSLQRLLDHYYGHAGRLNFVDKRAFHRHLRERLPALRPFFEWAERQTGIDWRLLAAIAYQESHWNPKAVSPTGVRGVMMLTRDTARQLGVDDRLDPEQSILGGARYLRIVEEKLPARITEPDRLWLTLAGYNIGFGHLEDARILAQKAGEDPDRWSAVRRHLPRLNHRDIAEQVRHGRADGIQAVEYVENIRNYYDLLVWYDNHPEDLAIQATDDEISPRRSPPDGNGAPGRPSNNPPPANN